MLLMSKEVSDKDRSMKTQLLMTTPSSMKKFLVKKSGKKMVILKK